MSGFLGAHDTIRDWNALMNIKNSRQEINRRTALTAGSVGALSMLNWKLPIIANAAQIKANAKSCILLWMGGGPSQFETFDPKMSAPGSIRSMTGAMSTNVPGTEFGGTMNQLAKHADKFTIVRSYQTGSSAHKIQPVVSPDTFGANIGSYLSRIIGTNNPKTGMP